MTRSFLRAAVPGLLLLLPACRYADEPRPPRQVVRMKSLGGTVPPLDTTVPPDATPVQRAIAAVRVACSTMQGDEAAFDELARFHTSREAVAELIVWLEYRSPIEQEWEVLPGGGFFRCGSDDFDDQGDWLAGDALGRIGAFAAPQLVDEYVHFFENTGLGSYRKRFTCFALDPQSRLPLPKSSDYRLLCVADALTSSADMAAAAVGYAVQRKTEAPDDDRLQRACQEVIDRVIAAFPNEKHRQLFPALYPSA